MGKWHHMVLLLAKNSKAGCLFRPNFLKQVLIEIQKMEHPVKSFQSTPPPGGKPLEKIAQIINDNQRDNFEELNKYNESQIHNLFEENNAIWGALNKQL